MSSALVDQLSAFPVDHFLTEIDNNSRDLDDQMDNRISIGPFGVLNFPRDISESNKEPVETVNDSEILELDAGAGVSEFNNASFPELSTAEEMLGNLDPYLQWDDIFNLDPPPLGWMITPPISGFEEQGGPDLTPPNSEDFPLLQDQFEYNQTALTQNDLQDLDILSEGHLLLRHFSENVVTRIIWLPMTQKSPWIILNIPHAMVTLDQITYMKQANIKHASLANLYGILACAAYHLTANPNIIPDRPNQYWAQVSATAYKQGKLHANKTIETELEGPNKAKYKEQLMALLSMTTFTVSNIRNNETFISRC